MSVPLDKLYNFLHSVCDHEHLIIYRFTPHGSKNICHLAPITIQREAPWNPKIVYMICNDQEPLDFDAYADRSVAENYVYNNKDLIFKFDQATVTQEHIEFYCKLNLRMVLDNPYFSLVQRRPVLLIHSEKNSQNVIRYEKLGMAGVYWWCHATIARDWFRYAEHDKSLHTRNPKYDFLVYNRAWSGTREYRLKFLEMLVDNDMVHHCQIKFSPYDNGIHYVNHVFQNSNFAVNRTDLEHIYTCNTADSNSSADYVSEDYINTHCEVVLETLFDDDRIHLTEKTLRPIACGHPFLLLSGAGSLEYLRSYGFETFGQYIDESYDSIQDPMTRMQFVVKEIQRIANLSHEQKQLMFADLRSTARKNQKLFFSSKWQNSVIDEFKINFQQAVQKPVTIDHKDFYNPTDQS